MARRGNEKAEVESLSEALEGAALEKQGLMKALAVKEQRLGAAERQNVSLLGKLAAAREEVSTSLYFERLGCILVVVVSVLVKLSSSLLIGGRFERSTWGTERRGRQHQGKAIQAAAREAGGDSAGTFLFGICDLRFYGFWNR